MLYCYTVILYITMFYCNNSAYIDSRCQKFTVPYEISGGDFIIFSVHFILKFG